MYAFIATVLLPGVVRLGPMRFSVYSLFAAAAIVVAITLSQRMARYVGLEPDRLWDVGIFTIVAAFVCSRALLVLSDFHAFLQYPVLVLSLPSLTYGGMMLTGLFTLMYMAIKRLPLLDVLDAWAPCACLLAAILQLGHFVEGTGAGMPTSLPWGIVTPGDTVLGKVHPVQLYAVVAALALAAVLVRLLAKPHAHGSVAATGLLAGSVSAFLLAMLRQPEETHGVTLLDPGQYLALLGIFAGAIVLALSHRVDIPVPMVTTEPA